MPRKTSKNSAQNSKQASTQDAQTDGLTKNGIELPADWNYEQTLTHIATITHQLETGDLPLAEVFSQFSEAVTALQQCDHFLQAKQAQASLLIETLVGDDADDAG